MKTYEVKALIEGNSRKIEMNETIEESFKRYKTIFENETEKEMTPADAFYAGYILSNLILREKLLSDK